ncbi:MAG: hypothetical protein K0Q95_2146 [Bacteroidota bacterium]|jgi:hypothetical protein|nr:hypothetical protein [Bacteroidota bacterium]
MIIKQIKFFSSVSNRENFVALITKRKKGGMNETVFKAVKVIGKLSFLR